MEQKLEVGQKLWYVPADSRYINQSREVVISKIGRQWAQIEGLRSDMRISLEDWSVDGRGYPLAGEMLGEPRGMADHPNSQ